MSAYPRPSQLAAYQSTATHGRVAASDPHGLILLLMNGALERISTARGCIQNKSLTEKARLLHRAVAIVDQLRGCLDLQSSNAIADNLDRLYDYICRQLLKASIENNVAVLDEVMHLLQDVRDGWERIPKDKRSVATAKQ